MPPVFVKLMILINNVSLGNSYFKSIEVLEIAIDLLHKHFLVETLL